MVKGACTQAIAIPEGLVDLQIWSLPVGLELCFLATCRYQDQNYRFHIFNNYETGELEIVPQQMVPYALREVQDILYDLLEGKA